MRIGFLIGGLALALMVIALVQWWPSEPDVPATEQVVLPGPESGVQPEIVQQPEVTPPTPEAVDKAPPVVLPALNDSDEMVRATLTELAIPQAWTAREDLLRRLAVVVENAARGDYPRRQLSFLAPPGKFQVIERGGEFYVDPANYQRYSLYMRTLEAIDPAVLAGVIRQFAPLVDEALAELGNQQEFLTELEESMEQVLSVPVRRGDVRLIQPKVFFEYAEPHLEALPALHKQVMRMGPDNTERLQRYLVALRLALRS